MSNFLLTDKREDKNVENIRRETFIDGKYYQQDGIDLTECNEGTGDRVRSLVYKI